MTCDAALGVLRGAIIKGLSIALSAVTCLACCSSLAQAAGVSETVDGNARVAPIAAEWTEGLKRGANGPVPLIVVDQFGYPSKSRKIAVIRTPRIGYDSAAAITPGKTYALADFNSGRILKEAEPIVWNGGAVDPNSGDAASWFDFSDITTAGKYVVIDRERNIRSVDFAIGDDVYRDVMKHALRTFFYQRSGYEKKPEFAGAAWADKASHLGSGQDSQSRPWPGAKNLANSPVRDLRGGWYDAGDFNKYTTWTARNIIIMLRAYDEHPSAFSDDLNIPESGNGIPDILDEMKWGLDWLIRMQNPDGSVLCIQNSASASPPSAAKGPSFYGPPTTAATLITAAAFAYASHIFAVRKEPEWKSYAADLATRAVSAWDWANKYPDVVYYNNDELRQPGSKGLAYGQQELSEQERFLARFEAASYLYELSGVSDYKQFVEAGYTRLIPLGGPSQWDVEAEEALLYVTRLTGISPTIRATILEKFYSGMRSNFAAADPKRSDPYLAPMRDYTWGSNKAKAMQARLYQLMGLYTTIPAVQERTLSAPLEYCHYLHGVNPLGMVYLTNMSAAGAKRSVTAAFHAWFAQGTKWDRAADGHPGPPPGYLVGGPNPSFALDGCCAGGGSACGNRAAIQVCQRSFVPPAGQPAAKSYADMNDGWPANSWQISEPSTGYQAYYIRLLASCSK